MTDDQLALALITAYKNRGIDMSLLLVDPMFTDLPASSKIEAIQKYAKDIESGINPRLNSVDWSRIAANAGFEGAAGAMAGAGLGRLVAAGTQGGITPLHATLIGATLLGSTGAIIGGLKAFGGVRERQSLKRTMGEVSANPTVPNAVYALSSNHMHSTGKVVRDNILNRIGDAARGAAHGHLEPLITQTHAEFLSKHSANT